ncbi:MAG: [FeFe] hydrogenase H-cluster radical SAM maturase HydG [Desulfobulbus sp.]|uniref:[FeFe] hydrogenase H-cluster radical SAM maturase HydG n=1 Tax=Desulfobulbus sp. TaxID=895 RepID=UPI0028468747|nr:[FeFe] hydrogenase H-cluster radical SAM maturase HydG [Desulfobulbus sp.]MDR2551309.1 [FeFe] hydrogenase H-cluster radical SAM maturase HydG [Desulfobulbus sp.]
MLTDTVEIDQFIRPAEIEAILDQAAATPDSAIEAILEKAARFEGLSHLEVASLLTMNDRHLPRLFQVARSIKEAIYGNRIVMFAPLYVSDYCVNRCAYCAYNECHSFKRRQLTQDEVRDEIVEIVSMGHKRIALEAGEDDVNCPIDYILDCLRTIYQTQADLSGEIRRVNVNIAATTVENYRKLTEVGIGTYILFQETYHQPTYERFHLAGPKRDYWYHTTAFDRAMTAGIDDVGAGVLFGLHDPLFEALAMVIHNEHLEHTYGVGFHTISVPRIRPAEGVDLSAVYPNIPDDETFKKIVAVLRLAVPYTGIIISTRETAAMRKDLLDCGITQMSACSAVGVGGYMAEKRRRETGEIDPTLTAQFAKNDERTADEIIAWLMSEGLVPSWCTACYRSGRTGDRFMALAKSGQIKNVCHPNALMTLSEYLEDYASPEVKAVGYALVDRELEKVPKSQHREQARRNVEAIRSGKTRDLYL